MKSEENYIDDLEYLSQQGLEKVTTTDSDLSDLKNRIRKRTRSYNRFYFVVGSLVVGGVIGAFLSFIFFQKPKESILPVDGNNSAGVPVSVSNSAEQKAINLDTVVLQKENFINPVSGHLKQVRGTADQVYSVMDSVDRIVSKTPDLSVLTDSPVEEDKLKYMINAPVFYLHDLKITNYTTLYFKKNRFVRFSGTSADKAYSEAQGAGVGLKQSADYFLHEEIAAAMLHFKKGRYDQAMNSLKLVSSYNESDLNCEFYIAMCYYYKKNYARASELFDLCISNSNNAFLQEACYYKALACFESGKKEEAKRLFKKIVAEKEFYSAKAAPYLME